MGRLNLAYGEAVDLLISIAKAEQMNSPLFLAGLGAVRRQLVASFSPEKRRKVKRLKSRIVIGVTASTHVQAGAVAPPRRAVQALHQAFLAQEVLQIRYRREDGATSERQIEPHYLYLHDPVWYVVAYDHLRQCPRTFRCDRMLAARSTGERFNLQNRAVFAASLVDDAQ